MKTRCWPSSPNHGRGPNGSLWIPSDDFFIILLGFVVFLLNQIHVGATGEGIRKFRVGLDRLVVEFDRGFVILILLGLHRLVDELHRGRALIQGRQRLPALRLLVRIVR